MSDSNVRTAGNRGTGVTARGMKLPGSGFLREAAHPLQSLGCMGRLLVALGIVAFTGTSVRAEGPRTTLELRISAPFVRTLRAPSLCPMVTVPLAGRWYVGGGYELLQDYDVDVQTSEDTGVGDMVMSGIRAGAWYRGGVDRRGVWFAGGVVVTGSHPYMSMVRVPGELDAGAYAVDLGVDISAGYTWDQFRLALFALPAWSFGQTSSTAQPVDRRFDELNLRVGVGLGSSL